MFNSGFINTNQDQMRWLSPKGKALTSQDFKDQNKYDKVQAKKFRPLQRSKVLRKGNIYAVTIIGARKRGERKLELVAENVFITEWAKQQGLDQKHLLATARGNEGKSSYKGYTARYTDGRGIETPEPVGDVHYVEYNLCLPN